MFDLNSINSRYFQIRIDTITLDVEPAKLKVLKRMLGLAKSREEDAIDDLTTVVAMILNKNKTGYTVPPELINELNIDQVNAIINAYFDWLYQVKNSPN